MNTLLAVGTGPDFSGSHGAGGTALVAAFALIGLVLLFAALRLIRKQRDPHHRYTHHRN